MSGFVSTAMNALLVMLAAEDGSALGTVIRAVVLVAAISGAVLWWRDRKAAKEARRTHERDIRSRGRIAARFGPIVLFAEPPRLYGPVDDGMSATKEWPITADTKATVESAGNVSVTRGRNLAAKAVGGALIPGGVFVFGNAKETAHDHRELYLIVADAKWAYTRRLDPNFGPQARSFAQAINLAARQLRPPPDSAPPTREELDVIGQLERLTELRDAGALTGEEVRSAEASCARHRLMESRRC